MSTLRQRCEAAAEKLWCDWTWLQETYSTDVRKEIADAMEAVARRFAELALRESWDGDGDRAWLRMGSRVIWLQTETLNKIIAEAIAAAAGEDTE